LHKLWFRWWSFQLHAPGSLTWGRRLGPCFQSIASMLFRAVEIFTKTEETLKNLSPVRFEFSLVLLFLQPLLHFFCSEYRRAMPSSDFARLQQCPASTTHLNQTPMHGADELLCLICSFRTLKNREQSRKGAMKNGCGCTSRI
jgi:hypothetical protein